MKTTPALVTLAALLGMVARTSAAAVSKEDQATMIKTKILTGMNTTEVVKGSCWCSTYCTEAQCKKGHNECFCTCCKGFGSSA